MEMEYFGSLLIGWYSPFKCVKSELFRLSFFFVIYLLVGRTKLISAPETNVELILFSIF